ncbi:YceI family protein [Plantactinospora mayteni]|uniref:Polyisoprenoid-binding protein n=1 Tax=Plantactinospora mayteni TaxID=566021 RepID=A0ABQ4EWP7_9ACTN|nr:YceI family protein [Plantactinospora mayteni]GIG99100.1 polyisoprenoid-binding protein [Plantactinospora mayteni]
MTATNRAEQQPGNGPGPDVPTGRYTIDPARSVIRFDTRAVFGLLPVRGTFRIGSGTIAVAPRVEESTAEAEVLAASFDSGLPERDAHVRSADYLDAAGHPYLRFRGERFVPSGDGGALHGQLTVRAVTRPVTLAVERVAAGTAELTARAGTTIDRYAFGLTTARGMTGRRIRLTLEIVATRG